MSGIAISFDSAAFQQQADSVSRTDLPKAGRAALDGIRGPLVSGLRSYLAETLDDPTSFTLNGFSSFLGRTQTPQLTVQVKDRQASYLRWEFEGGTEYDEVVPSKDAPLDSHGNLPRGYLHAVEAGGGFWMTARSGVDTLFVDDAKGMHAVAFRVEKAEYDKELDLEAEVGLLVGNLLPDATAKAFAQVFSQDR